MLLAKLIDIAAKLGYFYVRADILTTNDRSIKLFQKFGFQITDLYETYWLAGELWVDEVTVERSTKLAVPLHIKPHLTDKSRFEPVR
jgi:L-amino acid N-acyltransferase YncA